MPFIGIDWQINERTNLFGVLPASVTLEYKLEKKFFTGVVFRTFTNSYYDAGPNYIRIDENQPGVGTPIIISISKSRLVTGFVSEIRSAHFQWENFNEFANSCTTSGLHHFYQDVIFATSLLQQPGNLFHLEGIEAHKQ